MKYLFKIIVIIIFLSGNIISGQEILVDDFTNQIVHENFYEKTDVFPIQKSGENFFIIDDNEYLVSRNNSNSEYAIILESDLISNFFLKTSVRLGPSKNKNASIGIIIKADTEFNRAIILEVNRKGEFRIKELSNDKYIFLTGKSRKNGWVRNKNINKENLHNEIEVRNKKNNLNFIVNGKIISSLEIQKFNKGYCGLLIGADSKARIKYYYLNSNGDEKILKNKTEEIKKIEKEQISEEKTFENSQEINAIKNKNNSLKESLKTLEALKLINSELEENKLQLSNINLESKNIINDRENKINQLEGIIKEKEISEEKSKNTINDLKSELNIKEKEITIEYNKIIEVKNSNTEIIEKNNILKIEILKNTDEINKLQVQLKNTSSSLSAKEKKLKKEEAELVKLNSSHQISLEKIISKNSEIKLLNQNISNSNKTLESVKKKNSQEKELLINNKKKLEENLKKDITKISNQKDILVTTNNEFKKIIKTQKENIKDLKSKINDNKIASKANTEIINNLKSKNNKLSTSTIIHKKIILEQNQKITNQKNINNNLKEIFVYKDFELNGIKPSSLIAEKVGYLKAMEEIVMKDSIYSIQLGIFKTNSNIFNNIQDVFLISSNNLYKYYCGEYFNLAEVSRRKNELLELGLNNIHIVKILK
tara:strand:+ start:412 stop:2373 length:1962 start_codon:yes stop_codon:yes gene_type:complete